MHLILIPITPTMSHEAFRESSEQLSEILRMQALYQRVGYVEPWIGYLVKRDNEPIGLCAFTGPPIQGRVEIAYFSFPGFEGNGYATRMCRLLVDISRRHAPDVIIAARTLPEHNASTRVLEKNGFECIGMVADADHGPVWEWRLPALPPRTL